MYKTLLIKTLTAASNVFINWTISQHYVSTFYSLSYLLKCYAWRNTVVLDNTYNKPSTEADTSWSSEQVWWADRWVAACDPTVAWDPFTRQKRDAVWKVSEGIKSNLPRFYSPQSRSQCIQRQCALTSVCSDSKPHTCEDVAPGNSGQRNSSCDCRSKWCLCVCLRHRSWTSL